MVKYKRRYKKCVLLEEYWIYEIPTVIPVGFEWNGANIPSVFQKVLGKPMDKGNLEGSLVHDYLISIDYDVSERDYLFRKYLRRYGKGKLASQIMYLGVRLYSIGRKLFKGGS
jgi:hypothetical protein